MAEVYDDPKDVNGEEEVQNLQVRPVVIDSYLPAGAAESLPDVFRSFAAGIFSGEGGGRNLPYRVRSAALEHAPRLREASAHSLRGVHSWAREGGALRKLLVISVGTITLLALAGAAVFLIFLVTATVNAAIVSILVSMAAVGGFLAIFFGLLTAIYVGALIMAAIAISVTTVSTIIAIVVATGWALFFWLIYVAALKFVDATKQSVSLTSSAIASYTEARRPTPEFVE